MKELALTVGLGLFYTASLIAQLSVSPFIEIDESILVDSQRGAERSISPNQYKILQLDRDQLRVILKSAPQEVGSGSRKSEVFEVLLPDGKREAFHLVEYSMMEPALAAKYPSIKTYHGYGVRDASRRIRLDWTANGLHAMLQVREGLAFLKPYTKGDTKHYISYFERDLPVNMEPFECGTITDKTDNTISTADVSRAGDCQLRTYRLAIAVTGEYATTVLGASSAGTAADDAIVNAHIVTHINQINSWYERDLTARFILIGDLSDIFYYDGTTDPYTNGNANTMLGENKANLNATIGSANYDLGHVLAMVGGGSAGLASLNVLCSNNKARGVTRASANGITRPRFLKVWAHEIGHQFGAGHTQGENCSRSSYSAMEPGAGSTLMSYVTSNCANQIQNVPDYYFHAISIQQMSARMLSTSCAAILPSANSAPTVSAGPDVTVPSSTPLLLEAIATDPEGDPLTFTWEQFNNEMAEAIPPQATNTQGPNFRSLPPSNASERYLPNIAAVVAGATPTWEVLPSVDRTMDFRVTVRDNSTNSISCTVEDDISITTVSSGPFKVSSPTSSGVIWVEGETKTVSWDVAGTNVAPVSCANVDILLSYDGGFSYPVTLVTDVSNDGAADIVVPVGASTTARIQVRCSDNIFYNISANNFEIQVSNGPTFLLNLPAPLSTLCPGAVESNIPVTTSSVEGYSGDVTFSATNLPGGATVTFNSPIITAGSSTTFEIGNTSGLAQGNYTFTIEGASGSIVRDFDYVLSIEEPAGLTTLDLPLDNAVDIGIIPTLYWMEKSNASAYTVQVSSDPSFVNSIVNATVPTNSYSLNMSLAGLTLYYWRVKATTTCGDTPWSNSREFTTADCADSYIQNTPLPISANGTPEINSVITIGGSGTVDGLEVSNIVGTHSFVGDLRVQLIAPGGSPSVVLWDYQCGGNDNFHLSFSDAATVTVANASCSPLGQGGIYKPEDPLTVFDGLPIAGDWTLKINDNANQDGGELTTWRLDFCSQVALPVDLLSFDASTSDNIIRLHWRTANEDNNSHFEIERRLESSSRFTSIGKILAIDDPQQVNDYQYLDLNVEPNTRYYYRLRQNDYNGHYEYSEIRTVRTEAEKSGLEIYPNPVRGDLFGKLNIEHGMEMELELLDLNGRVIRDLMVTGSEFVMDMAGVSAGLYVVRVRHARGEEIVKVVVK